MNARQFVYRYEGDPKTDEVEEDIDGQIQLPQRGAVITRKGTTWKVFDVHTLSNPAAIPVYRVFLTKGSSK